MDMLAESRDDLKCQKQRFQGLTFHLIAVPSVCRTPLYFFLFTAWTMSQMVTPISTQPSNTPRTIAAMYPMSWLSSFPTSVAPTPERRIKPAHFCPCSWENVQMQRFTSIKFQFAGWASRHILRGAVIWPKIWFGYVSKFHRPSVKTCRHSRMDVKRHECAQRPQ